VRLWQERLEALDTDITCPFCKHAKGDEHLKVGIPHFRGTLIALTKFLCLTKASFSSDETENDVHICLLELIPLYTVLKHTIELYAVYHVPLQL
jgi:hypothetical protein